jgi:IS5 family transposase
MARDRQPGLFDSEFRMRKIDSIGDPLRELNEKINFERFRPLLERGFMHDEEEKGPGGRPPYDIMIRFKTILLSELYNLSDDATELLINDRRTFQRFIGIEDHEPAPDAKSIWHWREQLTSSKVFDKLFNKFWKILREQQIKATSGVIIDATFVEKPQQRNTRKENESIKNGNVPDEWTKPENKNKLRQKDMDATWTKKHGKTYYGYKGHIKIDKKTKLILKAVTTTASVHDSQVLNELLGKDDAGKKVYGDSAYTGKVNLKKILKKNALPKINVKGYRNKPLTKTQMKKNRKLSKVRSRVEHVFAYMERSMGSLWLRCVGQKRAHARIILKVTLYNMMRFCFLTR